MKNSLAWGGIIAAMVLTMAGLGKAETGPIITPYGPGIRFSVPYDQFVQGYKSQGETEDCWAASISNLFAYYGHPVEQQRIETTLYGGDFNLPAAAAIQISRMVNRDWVDDNGKKFHARLTAAYDQQAGVMAISNPYILNELRNNRPLLVCNTHHCMVIAAADVVGYQIANIIVFDPWPSMQEVHSLPPAEAVSANRGGQCMYIGAVRVTDDDSTSSDDSSSQ